MPNHQIVIPCRLESTRLPNKLLLEVDKKPVLWYTYQTALKTGLTTTILTDSHEIHTYCITNRLNVILDMQPANNGTERIANWRKAAPKIRCENNIINVQGDHPIFDIDLINKMAAKYRPATVVTGWYEGSEFDCNNPSKVKMIVKGQDVVHFSRANIPYKTKTPKIHIGIYKYGDYMPDSNNIYDWAEEDLEQLNWNVRNMWAFKSKPPVSIDTPVDFEYFSNIIAEYGYEGSFSFLYGDNSNS